MEIELKIGLATEADRTLLIKKFGPPKQNISQRNLFLDGENGELRAEKYVLRVRREREFPAAGPVVERVILALKGQNIGKGVLCKREEIENPLGLSLDELERSPARLLLMASPPISALKERLPALATLKSLGSFDNDRAVIPVALTIEGESVAMTWEVDRTVFPGGRVECELEIELGDEHGAEAIAKAVEDILAEAGVKTVAQPRGKFSRFLSCLK
ncbi:MAG: hypothetical protein COB53_07370 [Elusimicrobia bacterium]|nr:MAG: hypothetical protein COB53_07370 [Elusimicrobiota bacterium]